MKVGLWGVGEHEYDDAEEEIFSLFFEDAFFQFPRQTRLDQQSSFRQGWGVESMAMSFWIEYVCWSRVYQASLERVRMLAIYHQFRRLFVASPGKVLFLIVQ